MYLEWNERFYNFLNEWIFCISHHADLPSWSMLGFYVYYGR